MLTLPLHFGLPFASHGLVSHSGNGPGTTPGSLAELESHQANLAWASRPPATADHLSLKIILRDFPGGPVGKTPHSQCRGSGFNPWSGN